MELLDTLSDLVSETLDGPYGSLPMAQFLQAHGVLSMGAPRPVGLRRGRPRECFRNAWDLCLGRGMDYWESWAWDPRVGAMPFHHAWCVASRTGAVVDPTWPEPELCAYLGVHIPTELLCEVLNATSRFGILDRGQGFEAERVARHLGGLDEDRGSANVTLPVWANDDGPGRQAALRLAAAGQDHL